MSIPKPKPMLDSAFANHARAAAKNDYELPYTRDQFYTWVYDNGFQEIYAEYIKAGAYPSYSPTIKKRKIREPLSLDNLRISSEHLDKLDLDKGLKRCTVCDEMRPIGSFSKTVRAPYLSGSCKDCVTKKTHTLEGYSSLLYNRLQQSVKRTPAKLLPYSKQEFKNWISAKGYEVLYKTWAEDSYSSSTAPVVRRIDESLPYALDNQKLSIREEVTLKEVTGLNYKPKEGTEALIAKDNQQYKNLHYDKRPLTLIRNARQDHRVGATKTGYELDYSKEDLEAWAYDNGYSELYRVYHDREFARDYKPKIYKISLQDNFSLSNFFITTTHEEDEDFKKGLKRCTGCDAKKHISEFDKARGRTRNLSSKCKACVQEERRSLEGHIKVMYYVQLQSSSYRKHPKPSYTANDLRDWCMLNGYDELHKTWRDSGYKKELCPSADRLDSLKPYTFDNLELVTWKENNGRAHEDRRKGVGASGKLCRAVYQYTTEGELVAEYHSQAEAERVTGVRQANITKVVCNKRNTAGGFVWKNTKD